MENASDALKIAFAIIIFTSAITLGFSMISRVKSTADTVFYYVDHTNFRPHAEYSGTNRKVSGETVVSTLYRYYKESISVIVKLKDGAGGYDEYVFDRGNETNLLEGETPLETEELIEKNLEEFVTEEFNTKMDSKFTEKFVETPVQGKYIEGSDGSEIIVERGTKKIYITYEEE